MRHFFFLLMVAVLLVGCRENPTSPELETDPAGVEAAVTDGYPVASQTRGDADHGAWIGRGSGECYLPGIAADGTTYPGEFPCEVQFVLTRNGRDVATALFSGTVPNEYGQAVQVSYETSGVRCSVLVEDGELVADRYGDPNVDHYFTRRYRMTVSAAGNLHMACHWPDEG